MVVLSIRSTPTGAFSQPLANGLWPCRRIQGVSARNQTSSPTSLPPEIWRVWVTPWTQALPLAKADNAA